MAIWTVTLEKPGREDKVIQLPHLGAYIMLPVDRIRITACWRDEWRELSSYSSNGIFIERYALMSMNPDTGHAWAEFRDMHRSCELPRTFNPARLPT